MYNLYQYSHNKLLQRQQGKQQKVMQTFWNKHETLKKQAILKRKARLDDFIDSQITAAEPFVIPDEYMQRSVSDHHSIIKQKTQLGSSLNKFMSSRYNPKVTTNKAKVTTMNSWGGQGKGEELKVSKMDSKFLEPIPSFSSENQDNTSYSAIKFNQKAEQLLKRYENNKQRYEHLVNLNRDRYRLCRPQHFKQDPSSPHKPSTTYSNTKIFKQQNPQNSNIHFNEIGQPRSNGKTYFKLAKTQQLFTTDNMKKLQLNSLLGRSHYNRIKNEAYSTQLSGWSSVNHAPLTSSVLIS